ncbi:AraC-like DNA-binding protein/predicted enzyme related to lactoylglutathione lyase [Saccharomonospora amisosensis]|uniref:AraC-like DNA-binding protein/predicted enzyme related to lactoylglutathione lyase n=1 Tax=Saccharomonospora amisosensis TaxID=1128677 RepID=A0A7X5URW0_9PSEU|nr:AraC family transcriptional regulator [Saccharomonospora amisosensis]NIJ13053.1 AraC-like DNA-binding protein/predicted enzyme related to lactoylglutathione lyase [Saccharomonospora amisosensis]
MISRVASVAVYVRDQHSALDFYTRVLGFEVVSVEGGRAELEPAGGSTSIVLLTGERADSWPGAVYSCADIVATYESLRASGVQFAEPPTRHRGGVMTTFTDVDGNAFVLSETGTRQRVTRPLDGGYALAVVRFGRELIDRDFHRDIRIAMIASDAGLSPFQFIRLFKRTYGETPGQYLKRARMERAQCLLRYSRIAVAQIGHRVGYRSPGTFSDRFRKLVGLSPSEYRRKYYVELSGSWAPWYFAAMWARRSALSEPSATSSPRSSDTTGR